MSETKIQVRWPTVLLIEHGRTSFSAEGESDRIHGVRFDLPLIPAGRKDAERAAEVISEFDVSSLEHSPMKRAAETAEIIGKEVGIKPVPNDGLLPWDSGFLSGWTHGQAKEFIEYFVRNPEKSPRDGQPYGDWWEAFSSAMLKKMKEAEKTPGQVHILGVHSSEVTAAPAIIKGDPATVLNERLPGAGQIAALEKRGGRWRFIARYA